MGISEGGVCQAAAAAGSAPAGPRFTCRFHELRGVTQGRAAPRDLVVLAAMARERLDKLVQGRGLAASRERARALIMTGDVLVAGRPETKPGTLVDPAAEISLRAAEH